jgi:zinc protease
MDRLGANVSADSGLDASTVSLSAIKSELEGSIALWADIIQNPAFDAAEIERERTQLTAVIAQEKADPQSIALRLLPPAIYGAEHAYGVPFTGSGTEESVASMTREDLVAFKDNWLRPDNARLFIAGDVTLAEITPLLENALRGWTVPAAPKPSKNIAQVARPSTPRMILIDKPGSPQSFIIAGHVIPGLGADADLAIESMNGVLGGEFTARINMNLREEKGWAYGARTQQVSARGPRPLLVFAPVQTDRTGDSIAELVRELRTITSTRPITNDEMSRVIAGSTRELPGRFETAGAVLGSMASSARYGRPLDYAASLTERYEALTLTDLQNAARDNVHPESLIWIVVGDLSQIRGQVERLDIAPVEVWNDDGEPVN